MSASFRGHSFGETPQSGMFPLAGRKGETAVLHIPGSNNNVIQKFGRGVAPLALQAYCTASELSSLFGDVEQSGSLIFSYGTFTAFLESISEPREIGAHGKYFATLNFLI